MDRDDLLVQDEGSEMERRKILKALQLAVLGGAVVSTEEVLPGSFDPDAWAASAQRYALTMARDAASNGWGKHVPELTRLERECKHRWFISGDRPQRVLARALAVTRYELAQAYWDLGRYSPATKRFQAATQAADAAGDEPLAMLAQCGRAAVMVDTGDVYGGLGVLGDAAGEYEAAGPLAEYYLVIEYGLTHAAQNASWSSINSFDKASGLAERLADEEPNSILGRPFAEQAWMWEGRAKAAMGHKDAERLLVQDFRTQPPHRLAGRCRTTIDLAYVHGSKGNAASSSHLLQQAWPQAKKLESVRLMSKIDFVASLLPEGADSDRLKEVMQA